VKNVTTGKRKLAHKFSNTSKQFTKPGATVLFQGSFFEVVDPLLIWKRWGKIETKRKML